jgi:hypothetical protein
MLGDLDAALSRLEARSDELVSRSSKGRHLCLFELIATPQGLTLSERRDKPELLDFATTATRTIQEMPQRTPLFAAL